MVVEPMRDRRMERREATRAEILDAAWEIVRAEGLGALSLRDLARRVGMQAPSLYSYFDSKHAIYDAMFAQGNLDLLKQLELAPESDDPDEILRWTARTFVSFTTEDPARAQLLFMRTIPGFEPSPESYALAVRILEGGRAALARAGLTEPVHLDLWTAAISGLGWQQIANEQGGDRWTRLVDEVVDMYLTHVRRGTRRRRARK